MNSSSVPRQTLIAALGRDELDVVPGPNTATDNQLEGVAAVSATDVWAVGHDYDSSTNTAHTVIQRCVSGSRNANAAGDADTNPNGDGHAKRDADRTVDRDADAIRGRRAQPARRRLRALPSPTPTATRTASPTATSESASERHGLLPSAAAVADP